MKIIFRYLLLCGVFQLFVSAVNADRIKDITSLAGIRSNQLVGYGIVVGLAGSGDGNTGITLQSMQSLVARFGITSDISGFNGELTCLILDRIAFETRFFLNCSRY